jgi:predicted aconitase
MTVGMRRTLPTLLTLGTAAAATAAIALTVDTGTAPDEGRGQANENTEMKVARVESGPESGSEYAYAWPKKYTGVGLKADSNEVALD